MTELFDFKSGLVISDTYELISLLGQGGMGEVWKARHLRLPKEVALKILKSSAQASEEVVARFRREAEIISKLGHPGIVEVLDFNYLPDGRAYIAMELLSGEDLATRLSKGPVDYKNSISIINQVGAALQATHRAGIVHRDLKPENLFLSHREGIVETELSVHILDFGISKIHDSNTLMTQEHSILGTPSYMSPEQAKGLHTQIDARTDQFALATIAYELFTNQRAFFGAKVTEVLFKVVYEQPISIRKLKPDLPKHVLAAIEKAMAKSPEDRFKDIAEFVQALMGISSAQNLKRNENRIIANKNTVKATSIALDDTLAPELSEPKMAFNATLASNKRASTSPKAHHTENAHEAFAETLAHQSAENNLVIEKQTQVVSKTNTKTILFSLIALILVGVLSMFGLFLASNKKESKNTQNNIDNQPLANTTLVQRNKKEAAHHPPLIEKKETAPAIEVKTKKAPETKAPTIVKNTITKKVTTKKKTKQLSAEAKEDLKNATLALKNANYRDAIYYARRSMRGNNRSTLAFIIMAKAYCGKGNLGSALAMVRNVSAKDKKDIQRYCKTKGVSF